MRSLLDTLAGLHAAHDLADDRGQLLGLVHRDVSPQNVLVGADGSTRITDFGVARATARLTSTGSGKLKGKLAYMAPEQTRGDELDRRTDLFAAGIIVWECLAGKRLFKAETEAATLNRILVEPVRPLSEVNTEVPRVFDFFIKKALDRDPAQRFQTALDMGDALERTAIEAVKSSGQTAVASAREVSVYVQAILGQEIGAQRESVRAWLAQSDSGQPKISLPPRRRMGSDAAEDSDSGARRSFSGAAAFAPTDFSPLGPGLRESAELPATRVEAAVGSTLPPAAQLRSHSDGRPSEIADVGERGNPAPAAGAAAPGYADNTMRFALDKGARRDLPPPREPAPSITDVSPRPPYAAPSSAGPIHYAAPPPNRISLPPRPGGATLLGTGAIERALHAHAPTKQVPIPGLATTALTDDNEDAPTILNAKDAPPPGTIPVHKDPSKAVVIPDVKTARGLFASRCCRPRKRCTLRRTASRSLPIFRRLRRLRLPRVRRMSRHGLRRHPQRTPRRRLRHLLSEASRRSGSRQRAWDPRLLRPRSPRPSSSRRAPLRHLRRFRCRRAGPFRPRNRRRQALRTAR